MNQLIRRYCSAAALLAGFLFPASSFAGPQEDLQAGIDAFNQGDLIGAMAHYRVAADAGLAEAQVKLAYILDYSEDDLGAIDMYRAAADQGNADGYFGLGQMVAKGEGTEQDLEKAVEFFTVAANNGSQRAIGLLARVYEKGMYGLQANPERATYWRGRLKTQDPKND